MLLRNRNGWLTALITIMVLAGCRLSPLSVSLTPPATETPSAIGPQISTPVAGPQVGTPGVTQTASSLPTPIPPTGTVSYREMPPPRPIPHHGGTPEPFPQPGDRGLQEGPAWIDQVALKEVEGQLRLYLSGRLPTPCHHVRIQIQPFEPGRPLRVRVYSVFDPQAMCIQVIQPFELEVPLEVPLDTVVEVNGQPVPRVP